MNLNSSLDYQPPLAWEALTGFLVSRSDGMSQGLIGQRYVRTLRMGAISGWIAARPVAGSTLEIEVSSSLRPSLAELRPLLCQLFDLDANPPVIDRHLATDPALAPLVQRQPGLRLPGSVDGFELALRAILGQQISVKAATTLFRRMVEAFGDEVVTPFPDINRLPPKAEVVAGLPSQALLDLGITRRRADTIIGLARVMAAGDLVLSPAANPELCRQQLLALPGIGPWTANYVSMRALADPDAFPQADLGLLRGMKADNPAHLEALSQRWRPWRAYAAFHIWHALGQGG
ncbi:DNA-3-methyladenine glycosylase [uncultured Marinobacter sp.]|uniref:DNA-3-methyladenine glycosylase family protein n=1 Tax=uncultured Marinobacter sp. TaxID=187379 RepID=UPI0030DD7B94